MGALRRQRHDDPNNAGDPTNGIGFLRERLSVVALVREAERRHARVLKQTRKQNAETASLERHGRIEPGDDEAARRALRAVELTLRNKKRGACAK